MSKSLDDWMNGSRHVVVRSVLLNFIEGESVEVPAGHLPHSEREALPLRIVAAFEHFDVASCRSMWATTKGECPLRRGEDARTKSKEARQTLWVMLRRTNDVRFAHALEAFDEHEKTSKGNSPLVDAIAEQVKKIVYVSEQQGCTPTLGLARAVAAIPIDGASWNAAMQQARRLLQNEAT